MVEPGSAPLSRVTPDGARLGWVDAARGAAILLVVLLHTQGAMTALGFDHPALDAASAALATVRMPTFFLVSGLLAERVLAAPAGEFLRRRPANYCWLYLVWSLLHAVVAAVLALLVAGPDRLGRAGAAAAAELAEAATAGGVLWYFLALALYFPLARLTRRVPPAGQLAMAAVVFALTALGVVRTGSWGLDHILQLYVFFLAGLHLRPAVLARARGATLWRCVLLAAAWVALGAGLRAADPSGRLFFAVLPPLGVLLAVELAALLGERAWLRWLRWLRRVGRMTLPVYVLHPLVLMVAAAALPGSRVAGVPLPVQVLAVAVATAVVAVVSVAAAGALTRVPWLMGLPEPFSRRSA